MQISVCIPVKGDPFIARLQFRKVKIKFFHDANSGSLKITFYIVGTVSSGDLLICVSACKFYFYEHSGPVSLTMRIDKYSGG